jgi:hypothetical protein
MGLTNGNTEQGNGTNELDGRFSPGRWVLAGTGIAHERVGKMSLMLVDDTDHAHELLRVRGYWQGSVGVWEPGPNWYRMAVDAAYLAVLRRHADSEGLQFWSAHARDQGWNYKEITDAIRAGAVEAGEISA